MKKPAAVVASEQPFFDPGGGCSMMPVTQPAEVFTGASPVQAIRDVTATQPCEAPGTRGKSAANMTATQLLRLPVQGRSAIPPVEVPGASSDVQFQPTGTSSRGGSAMDRSLTSTRTVTDNSGVSDTEDEMLVNRNPLLQRVTGKCCQTGTQSRKTSWTRNILRKPTTGRQ